MTARRASVALLVGMKLLWVPWRSIEGGCILQLFALLFFHQSDAHLLRTLVLSRALLHQTSFWMRVFVIAQNGAQLHRVCALYGRHLFSFHSYGALFFLLVALVATWKLMVCEKFFFVPVLAWHTQWSRVDVCKRFFF